MCQGTPVQAGEHNIPCLLFNLLGHPLFPRNFGATHLGCWGESRRKKFRRSSGSLDNLRVAALMETQVLQVAASDVHSFRACQRPRIVVLGLCLQACTCFEAHSVKRSHLVAEPYTSPVSELEMRQSRRAARRPSAEKYVSTVTMSPLWTGIRSLGN
jgi:hypothetical protein